MEAKEQEPQNPFQSQGASCQGSHQGRLRIGPWSRGLYLSGITLICFDKAKFSVQSSRCTSAELTGGMRPSPNPTDTASAAAFSHALAFHSRRIRVRVGSWDPFGGSE